MRGRNDSQLLERAITACRNYYTVYGAYPGKVGILWQRLRTMQHTCIHFPVLQPGAKASFCDEVLADLLPSFSMQLVPLEGVQGATLQWNEVYLPSFSATLEQVIISGEQMAVMAARKRGKEA